jgi:hypothetical protein
MILPLVLNGCDTWSLTLREEYGLKVFENRMLKKMFGRKMDEVTGKEPTKRASLYSEFLTKYYLNDQIKKNDICSACGTYERHEKCL